MEQFEKDCLADYERRQIAAEVFDGQVESAMKDEIREIYENADKWVGDHVADTHDITSQVFSTCAAYSGKKPDYEMIGKIVMSIFEREVKEAARYEVENY